MTVPESIADRVVVAESGCWEWQNNILRSGYAVFRRTTAHRWVYSQLVGPVPDGLQVDHLCRNRRCVNPAHLEAVTPRENLLRGQTITAAKAAQTHCVRGHEFDEANTRVRANGTRQCRACDRAAYHRRKALVAPLSVAAPLVARGG